MIKKSVLIPLLCALLSSSFYCGVNAMPLHDTPEEPDSQTTSYEKQNLKNGWLYESGAWRYYKNGEALEGWHYLPANNEPEKNRWFYFLNDGIMLTDNTFRSDLSADENSGMEKYFGKIQGDSNYRISYEHVTVPEGWHKISAVTPEDEVPGEITCCIIRTGLDEYSIREFSDGKWKVLGSKEGETGFERYTGSDNQKWSVIKNPDDTFTFINRGTCELLNFENGSFKGASLFEAESGIRLTISDRIEARPEFFGAVGDGYADDTFPVFYAVNNSKTVVFSNKYNTSRTIDIKKDGVNIIGDGGAMITHPDIRTFMVKAKDVTFDSMTFQGNSNRYNTMDGSSIFFLTEPGDGDIVEYNAKIQNCKFLQTGHRCIHIHSARVSDEDYTPLSIASGITVKNCEFETYRLAVCCSGPDNVLVDSCTFSDGYYEHVTFDWRSRYCKAVNNRFLSGEGGIGAIGLDTAENIEILDNDFNYTNLFGITMNNEAGKSINVVISGNTFRYGGGYGGILFKELSEYGVAAENVTITDNTFDNEGSDSVVLNSAEGTVTFSDNTYLSGKPIVRETSAYVTTDF